MYQIITTNTGQTQVIKDYKHNQLFPNIVLAFTYERGAKLPPKQQVIDNLYRSSSVAAMRTYIESIEGLHIVE